MSFLPGTELPAESAGKLYAVLCFLFYGDKLALADIEGRGLCIPSGRIEAGETIDAAIIRECEEETGAHLDPEHRALIGCYRMVGRKTRAVRWCPVFVADALGFGELPAGSESKGVVFTAPEDVADLYFFWDELLAAVFVYAEEKRGALLPGGILIPPL